MILAPDSLQPWNIGIGLVVPWATPWKVVTPLQPILLSPGESGTVCLFSALQAGALWPEGLCCMVPCPSTCLSSAFWNNRQVSSTSQETSENQSQVWFSLSVSLAPGIVPGT